MLASHEDKSSQKKELFCAVRGQTVHETLKVVANTVSNLRKKLAGCGALPTNPRRGLYFCKPKGERPRHDQNLIYIVCKYLPKPNGGEYVMKDLCV